MRGLKVAVIGAGSTYTPEVVSGFIDRAGSLTVDELSLMDINNDKLPIVAGLVKRIVQASGLKTRVVTTLSLEDALDGADYVLGQIRVGGLAARASDERTALASNLLGQETTGIVGMMKGIRTIPAVLNIAETMARLSKPGAWLINFSNPSGMVAEAVLNRTGVNMVGLCNSPINTIKHYQNKYPGRQVGIRYVGLNHLAFVVDVFVDGASVMPELLEQAGKAYEEISNDSYLALPTALLQAIPVLPCSYVSYYYFRDRKIKELQAKPTTRGEDCLVNEAEVLKEYADETLCSVPDSLKNRFGANYSTAAVSLIDAIENDLHSVHILNVRNEGAYPFMAHDDVVEVACVASRTGIRPISFGPFDQLYVTGLMQAVKAYEKLTVKAAITGEKHYALAALMTHPLVGDYDRAIAALNSIWR